MLHMVATTLEDDAQIGRKALIRSLKDVINQTFKYTQRANVHSGCFLQWLLHRAKQSCKYFLVFKCYISHNLDYTFKSLFAKLLLQFLEIIAHVTTLGKRYATEQDSKPTHLVKHIQTPKYFLFSRAFVSVGFCRFPLPS